MPSALCWCRLAHVCARELMRSTTDLQLCSFVEPEVDNASVCAWLLEHDNICAGVIAKDSATNLLCRTRQHQQQQLAVSTRCGGVAVGALG